MNVLSDQGQVLVVLKYFSLYLHSFETCHPLVLLCKYSLYESKSQFLFLMKSHVVFCSSYLHFCFNSGLNKGYPVEKRAKVARPSHAKAVSIFFFFCVLSPTPVIYDLCPHEFLFFIFIFYLQRISKRTKMVRELITEVVGLSPYEKRLIDILKTGGASSEKKIYKYAKKRVRQT